MSRVNFLTRPASRFSSRFFPLSSLNFPLLSSSTNRFSYNLLPSRSFTDSPAPLSLLPAHPASDSDAHPGDSAQKATEVKDAEIIFRSVWQSLLDKYGEENLSFPPSIIFLAGAPGAGKGAVTPKILEYMGITNKPIEVSSLLVTPEVLAIKARGDLVEDRLVISLLFETLLRPEYRSGIIVDGFIRSRIQAECCKLLYDKMQILRAKYSSTPLYQKFRRPIFHIVVLYIDRDQSIRRQLNRGQQAKQHNEVVNTTGIGKLQQLRETDVNPLLAEERYKQFKSQVYDSLKSIKEKFHFHFINADGSPSEVQERILHELKYQSSLELGDETFEKVRKLPLASEIIVNARHELVRRLDDYRARQSELFDRVIAVIMNDFIHIIKRQALSGRAIIRSSSPVFGESGALDMALDLLSERGYNVVLDVQKQLTPFKIDLSTGLIESKERRLYEFSISFQPPNIRKI